MSEAPNTDVSSVDAFLQSQGLGPSDQAGETVQPGYTTEAIDKILAAHGIDIGDSGAVAGNQSGTTDVGIAVSAHLGGNSSSDSDGGSDGESSDGSMKLSAYAMHAGVGANNVSPPGKTAARADMHHISALAPASPSPSASASSSPSHSSSLDDTKLMPDSGADGGWNASQHAGDVIGGDGHDPDDTAGTSGDSHVVLGDSKNDLTVTRFHTPGGPSLGAPSIAASPPPDAYMQPPTPLVRAADVGAGAGADTSWLARLNAMLQQHGFQSVRAGDGEGSVDGDDMLRRMSDVFGQFNQRGDLLQESFIETDVSIRHEGATSDFAKSLRRANHALKRQLAAADEKARAAQEELSSAKRQATQQVQMANQRVAGMKRKLGHMEHQLRAKEAVLEKVQQRCEQAVSKERGARERDVELFRRIHQRSPSKGKAADMRQLDIIRAFEAQRDALQRELRATKLQVKQLNTELREERNGAPLGSSATADVAGAAAPALPPGSKVAVDTADAQAELAAATARIARAGQRESSLQHRVADLEQALASARAGKDEAVEDAANLRLELDSRPSPRDLRASQRRITFLEKRLDEAEHALQGSNDRRALRAYVRQRDALTGATVPTSELIRRDKLNKRLGLHRLDALPRETAREVLQAACRELEVSDVLLIAPSIRKLTKAMLAVPRMEKFIRDVCSIVFMHSSADALKACAPDEKENDGQPSWRHSDATRLEDVVPTLRTWLEQISSIMPLKRFEERVVKALLRRPAGAVGGQRTTATDASGRPTRERCVAEVTELVTLEREIESKHDTFAEAERSVAAEPSLLVNRLISHFRELFGVKKMDGVLPKMNEIYLFVNEMEHKSQMLRAVLGRSRKDSIDRCIAVVREMVEDSAKGGSSSNGIASAGSNANAVGENYVVSRSSKQDLVGVDQVREMSKVLRELKVMLGAKAVDDIIPRFNMILHHKAAEAAGAGARR